MTKPAAEIILANLANYVVKLDDAPCSAQSHFDYAIYMLSEICRDWQPSDKEIIEAIRDSRAHMSYFYPNAKNSWPTYD
jgi:hypothetical protein